MGCTGSKGRFNFDETYRQKYTTLVTEHQKLVQYFEQQIDTQPSVEIEQLNAMKYKLELMVTMLAIEQKSKEVLSKRLDTMKWMLSTQGKSEQSVDELLQKYRMNMTSIIDAESNIDISTAIEKMKATFDHSRDDIINILVDEDGNILLNITREEFQEKLSLVTNMSKKDLMVLSLRFFDGTFVSTTDFISFFSTPTDIRLAQTANNAVNMAQDILDIQFINTKSAFMKTISTDAGCNDMNITARDSLQSLSSELEFDSMVLKRRRTKNFDFCLTKLVILWKYVRIPLSLQYMELQQDHGSTLSSNVFKDILVETCGDSKALLETINTEELHVNEDTLIKMSILTVQDITIVLEYFDFGGRIHFNQFYTFLEGKYKILDLHELRNTSNFDVIVERLMNDISNGQAKRDSFNLQRSQSVGQSDRQSFMSSGSSNNASTPTKENITHHKYQKLNGCATGRPLSLQIPTNSPSIQRLKSFNNSQPLTVSSSTSTPIKPMKPPRSPGKLSSSATLTNRNVNNDRDDEGKSDSKFEEKSEEEKSEYKSSSTDCINLKVKDRASMDKSPSTNSRLTRRNFSKSKNLSNVIDSQ